MTTITLPRTVVEQALDAMRRAVPTGKITLYEWDKALSDLADALARIEWVEPLAQQAEPVLQGPVRIKPGSYTLGATWVGGGGGSGGVGAPPQQAEPDHETRAELAEQQVVQLAEERDHYRNLWQKAQQPEPVDTDCHTQGICQRSGYGIPKP